MIPPEFLLALHFFLRSVLKLAYPGMVGQASSGSSHDSNIANISCRCITLITSLSVHLSLAFPPIFRLPNFKLYFWNMSLRLRIDPLVGVHYADLKPPVNSYIQQLVQIKWDVAVYGRDLYFVKPTLGPPKKFQHLTRAEEVVIIQLRIGHTKATKSHILSRGPPTTCHHCGQTLTIDHMLLECAVL